MERYSEICLISIRGSPVLQYVEVHVFSQIEIDTRGEVSSGEITGYQVMYKLYAGLYQDGCYLFIILLMILFEDFQEILILKLNNFFLFL